MNAEEIKKKLDNEEPISLEEERWYLLNVRKLPEEMVEKLLEIAYNEDLNLIID